MATEAQVNQLRQLADIVTKKPIDEVVANADWGKINFEGARKGLLLINSIATGLKTLPVDRLPGDDINNLINPLVGIAAQLDLMSKFSIEQNQNPINQRDGIVANLNAQANELYAQSQLRVPFLAFQRADVRENEERFAKAVGDARDLLDSAKSKSEKSLKEIADIITAAREASASVGVAHYTADFDKAAAALDKEAKRWLTATAFFAVATVVAALVFPFIFKIEDGHQLQAVQVFTSKLVAIGTFLTATIWCGRLFKAAKHQAAVNHHRSNALKTFQAFVKSASDDQTRDAVLLETTRSIFALAQSGYLDGPESLDSATKVLEIVKSASSTTRQ